MTNKNYVSGANFERVVKKDLEKIYGVWCIRSAGSHSELDLVAMWPDGSTWVIQCKKHGVITAKEKEELIQKAIKYHRIPYMAIKIRGGYELKRLV